MKPRTLLSWGNFFAFLHYDLITYILAPYLATFMPANAAALPISLGAIITIASFMGMPRLIERYGPQKLATVFGALEGITLLFLAFTPSPLAAITLVAIACGISPLIVYQLDILLEAIVPNEYCTGRIRTIFITAGNIALVLSPLVVALLLGHSNLYGRVFLVAALTTLPFILLMLARTLPHVQAPKARSFPEAALRMYLDPDLRAVALGNMMLQFLFHLTPLYVPLYLHTVLGMPWSQLGWVLAVVLIPFVLIEYPAGWLADTRLGDKVLLAIGFVIAGLSFAGLGFVTKSTPLIEILLLLIVLRIGGALIESMVESHFFRRVNDGNADAVSVFRTMRPLGALTAPIVGSLLLSVGSFSSLFTITGCIILIGGLASSFAIVNSLKPATKATSEMLSSNEAP